MSNRHYSVSFFFFFFFFFFYKFSKVVCLSFIIYLTVTYRNFSVTFYNSSCDDMIAVTSEVFRNCFNRLLPALLHFTITS